MWEVPMTTSNTTYLPRIVGSVTVATKGSRDNRHLSGHVSLFSNTVRPDTLTHEDPLPLHTQSLVSRRSLNPVPRVLSIEYPTTEVFSLASPPHNSTHVLFLRPSPSLLLCRYFVSRPETQSCPRSLSEVGGPLRRPQSCQGVTHQNGRGPKQSTNTYNSTHRDKP